MNKILLPFSLILVLSLFCFSNEPVHAQQTGESWSTPVNISNMQTDSAYPVIVADQGGIVHVFWSENLPEYGPFNNVIYYTRLDQKGWTKPVDILTSPEGGLEAMADYPNAVIGNDGVIHLVFVGGYGGAIYYSSVHNTEATQVRSWKTPVLLSRDISNVGYPNILVDHQGSLHVIFLSGQGQDQGIYHVVSKDNGASWSYPALIPRTNLNEHTIIVDCRASISNKDIIHVAWAWTTLNLFPPKGIYYTHSDDSGLEWIDPLSVAEGPYRYPDVLASGNNQVYIAWSGTSNDRYKFSRWSDDGGLTWSSIYKMADIGGMQGYSGMAVDSLGKLYLGMAASCFSCNKGSSQITGDALIYSIWNGDTWTKPESLMENSSSHNNLQFSDIAISEGNIANIVVMYPIDNFQDGYNQWNNNQYQFDIFYVRGLLNSPHIEPRAIATDLLPTPTATPAETVIANLSVTTSPKQPLVAINKPVTPNSFSSFLALIVGAVPVGILLALIIILKKWISVKI